MSKNLDAARVGVPQQLVNNEEGKLVWKVDLLATKSYWTEIFTNLTNSFLDNHMPKLLCLASNDRMDKELTIAHMQGKFKLNVLMEVGHAIQEDDPHGLAKAFREFIETFNIKEKAKELKTIVTPSGKVIVINP